MSTLFSKIIAREIPSYPIYEDEHIFAFLDINPMNEGHTLVVPKQEVDALFALDDTVYDHMMSMVKKLALHIQEKVGSTRMGLVVDGYNVPHAHVHLVPTNHPHELSEHRQMAASPEDLEKVRAMLTLIQ